MSDKQRPRFDVLMSDYTIHQKTGSPHEHSKFAESTIQVNFLMIAPRNYRSEKHEEFLDAIREFLKAWNESIS